MHNHQPQPSYVGRRLLKSKPDQERRLEIIRKRPDGTFKRQILKIL